MQCDNKKPVFEKYFRCYPVAHNYFFFKHWDQVELGGKIILPPAALRILNQSRTFHPMFRIETLSRYTHCGVREFTGKNNYVHVPGWMVNNLKAREDDLLQISNVLLPTATYCKFKPVDKEFYNIANPKFVVESSLAEHSCLTIGDIIPIKFNDRIFKLEVINTEPQSAVYIVDSNMQIDFSDMSPKLVFPDPMDPPQTSLSPYYHFSPSGSRDEARTHKKKKDPITKTKLEKIDEEDESEDSFKYKALSDSESDSDYDQLVTKSKFAKRTFEQIYDSDSDSNSDPMDFNQGNTSDESNEEYDAYQSYFDGKPLSKKKRKDY